MTKEHPVDQALEVLAQDAQRLAEWLPADGPIRLDALAAASLRSVLAEHLATVTRVRRRVRVLLDT
ncbi:hypothetical protein [Streptomyces sp. cg36]|uniref:hypothetical protein n=1 Tax=Streptomyces sp. cg36 TaxID=3238798 RepID=UPI0034E19BC5